MMQAEAKSAITKEWYRLLDEDKRNDPAAFCLRMVKHYPFRCNGDPYQTIMGWVLPIRKLWMMTDMTAKG